VTYPLELIRWRDSYGPGSHWKELPEEGDPDPEPLVCESVGWTVQETDDLVLLFPHVGPKTKNTDAQGCGEMAIPKVAIVERIPLKVPKR
jgi:hypothetical protein